MKSVTSKSKKILALLFIFVAVTTNLIAKTKLTVWFASDEEAMLCTEFNKLSKDYTLVTKQFDGNTQMEEAYLAANESGKGIPDLIFDTSNARLSEIVDKGYLYDLSTDLADSLSQFYPSAVISNEGKIYCVYHNLCSNVFMYRRSLAKKYLGTDNPADIQKMLSTNDNILKTAEKIYKNSNGTCLFIPAVHDLYDMFAAQCAGPVIDPATNKLDPVLYQWVAFSNAFRNNGYTTKVEQWQGLWLSANSGKMSVDGIEKDVFCYIYPCWGITLFDKNLYGDFGAVQGPSKVSFFGGSVIGVSAKSKKAKEAAVCCKELVTGKANLSTALAKKYFPASVDNGNQFKCDEWNAFFGGQDYISLLRTVASVTNTSPITKQTDDFKQYLWNQTDESATNAYIKDMSLSPEQKLFTIGALSTDSDGDNKSNGTTIQLSTDAVTNALTATVKYGKNTDKNNGDDRWAFFRTTSSGEDLQKQIQKSNALSFTATGDDATWQVSFCMKQITCGYGYHFITFQTHKGVEQTVLIPYTAPAQDPWAKQVMPFNIDDVVAIEIHSCSDKQPEGTVQSLTLNNFKFIKNYSVNMEDYLYKNSTWQISHEGMYDKNGSTCSFVADEQSKSFTFKGTPGKNTSKTKDNDSRFIDVTTVSMYKPFVTKWLSTGNALSFKILGDGNTYILKLNQTTITQGYEFAEYSFTTEKGVEQEVIVPYTAITIPAWASQKVTFSIQNVNEIKFSPATYHVPETTTFDVKISDLKVIDISSISDTDFYKSSYWEVSCDSQSYKNGSTCTYTTDENAHSISITATKGSAPEGTWASVYTAAALSNTVQKKGAAANALQFKFKGDGNIWGVNLKMKSITQGYGYHYLRINTRKDVEQTIVVPYELLFQDDTPQKMAFNKDDVFSLAFNPQIWGTEAGKQFYATVSDIQFITINTKLANEKDCPIELNDATQFKLNKTGNTSIYAECGKVKAGKQNHNALIITGKTGSAKDKWSSINTFNDTLHTWLPGKDCIKITCVGDGKSWTFHLFANKNYFVSFTTKKDELTEIIIPFSSLFTWDSYEPLDPAQVNGFEFSQDGISTANTPFSLAVVSITAGTMQLGKK